MPRRARLVLAGIPLHLIQRGNNHQACFFRDDDYVIFLDWLKDYAVDNGCHVHAYVLMTNHVHLLLTAERQDGAAGLMKSLGQRYVQHVNRLYHRSGTLWEGRYRSCPVQGDAYLFACQHYIEMNPVRAGMVATPGDYPWSSFAANALGRADALIYPHPLYQGLGADPTCRQAAYRRLFDGEVDDAAPWVARWGWFPNEIVIFKIRGAS